MFNKKTNASKIPFSINPINSLIASFSLSAFANAESAARLTKKVSKANDAEQSFVRSMRRNSAKNVEA